MPAREDRVACDMPHGNNVRGLVCESEPLEVTVLSWIRSQLGDRTLKAQDIERAIKIILDGESKGIAFDCRTLKSSD